MELLEFIKKKVYIELRNGRKYEGKIKSISDDKFVIIIDKFGRSVGFSVNEIELIQEENL